MMANNEQLLPKTSEVTHFLDVTLEDMHNGRLCRLAVNMNRECAECDGRGSPQETPTLQDCGGCLGTGTTLRRIRKPNKIFEYISTHCSMCWGSGQSIIPLDQCPTCNGEKVVAAQYFIDVNVKRGTRHGHKIIYEGEGTQEPNMRLGDLVVIVEATEHLVFERNGDDLALTITLGLTESLCGFDEMVTRLDNRKLRIRSLKGQVTADNATMCIPGMGMPKYKNPSEKGELKITFRVILPDRITYKQQDELLASLPPRQYPDELYAVEGRLRTLEEVEEEQWTEYQYMDQDSKEAEPAKWEYMYQDE